MENCNSKITVLVADDDEDDRILIREAFKEHCQCFNLKMVEDGVELIEYLHREDIHPGFIFLDLNMPKMNGTEALQKIKEDENSKNIPIIIFTTTDEQDVIARTYCAGASTFIRKPTTFERLSYTIGILSAYWCEIALLPSVKDNCPE